MYPISLLHCNESIVLRYKDVPRMSFSMLLNFRTDDESDDEADEEEDKSLITKTACLDKEWLAPNDQCIEVQCTVGKYLKGGKCVEYIKEIIQLGYSFQLYFVTQGGYTKMLSSHFIGERSIERTTRLFLSQVISPYFT
nr:hypothetical protein BgiMline_004289 [Biomphalaria glabrata]